MINELNKTIAHLRETRKAILGRGGIVEPTCGLKDLPEAIWNIPADMSLASIEDNSSAYEKIVPSNVEGYAYLSSVGCLIRQNNNICIADGVYELSGETEKVFDLGTLSYGEYYIAILGDIEGYTGMQVWAENGPIRMYDDSGARECYFTVEEGEDVYDNKLTLMTDTSLNGTITGIMLCMASDADKSYKPYQKPYNLCIADGYYDLGSRPHNLEGQNLKLDLGELKKGVYQFEWYGTVSKMGPIVVQSYGGYLEYREGKPNGVKFGLTNTDSVVLKLSSEAGYDNMWDNPAWNGFDVDAYCWGAGSEITGIMLYKLSDSCSGWDDVLSAQLIADLEYKPYVPNPIIYVKPTGIESRGVNTEEPIDVIEIPEVVQSLEGYGIGISDNECNYIDLRRKVFVNEYEEVSNGVVQKRENPIEIDLSQLFPKATTFLKVEGGGKIIFHNEHKQVVPSKIKYTKRME